MNDVLGPVVAGTFYPADPGRLRSSVHRYLDAAPAAGRQHDVRALIVPHAGHVYSGPVAASGYARLRGAAPSRIILIGPSHATWFSGLAVPEANWWATPLGRVPIEVGAVINDSAVDVVAAAFRREHCLEVQLPFLQAVLDSFVIVPLLTGDVEPSVAAEVLDSVLDDDSLLIVSSDLSHYHDYDTALARDRSTAGAIVAGRPGDLGADSACGRTAVQAALRLAAGRGWSISLLDLRNSGDTAGPRDRVVGYGAFALG
jgi:AmmeMemoRadiSam system protein B